MSCRPSLTAAMAFLVALALCPCSVQAGGLRGIGSDLAHNEGHKQKELQQRKLGGEVLDHSGMTNWAMTTLEPLPSSSPVPNINHHDKVSIDQFTTYLLATDFPYPLTYQTEQELSGAISRHVASYLRGAIDAPLLNLGVHCAKYAEPLGPERRWVLSCDGAAIFDETPLDARTRTGSARRSTEVNAAVRRAFAGQAKSELLEEMYPRYEMVREEGEWGAERARRSRERKKRENAKKKKTKEQRNNKKNQQKKRKKSQKKKQQLKPTSEAKQRQQSNDGGVDVPPKRRQCRPLGEKEREREKDRHHCPRGYVSYAT